MPHPRTHSRTPAAVTLLILLLASAGLAACGSSGSSSSTSAQTTANAAATGTPGTTSSGTSSTGTTPGTTPSGTSSTGTTPAGRPNAGRFTAMRACLARKGIALPQRTPGAGGPLGGGPQLPKGVTRAQFAEALKSCSGSSFTGNHFHRVPHAFNSPRFHQALARFAACLRQNGVNVGEPNTTGKGPVFDTKGINTGSPQFKAAATKCRSVLFSGSPPKATPGAAG
ncbi:MAG: hypothetical protein ACRDLF_09130 [Solirubrobacteraceae bacterium]